jgi:hypothetical protein
VDAGWAGAVCDLPLATSSHAPATTMAAQRTVDDGERRPEAHTDGATRASGRGLAEQSNEFMVKGGANRPPPARSPEERLLGVSTDNIAKPAVLPAIIPDFDSAKLQAAGHAPWRMRVRRLAYFAPQMRCLVAARMRTSCVPVSILPEFADARSDRTVRTRTGSSRRSRAWRKVAKRRRSRSARAGDRGFRR